jgi:hypothetical protein
MTRVVATIATTQAVKCAGPVQPQHKRLHTKRQLLCVHKTTTYSHTSKASTLSRSSPVGPDTYMATDTYIASTTGRGLGAGHPFPAQG